MVLCARVSMLSCTADASVLNCLRRVSNARDRHKRGGAREHDSIDPDDHLCGREQCVGAPVHHHRAVVLSAATKLDIDCCAIGAELGLAIDESKYEEP